MTDLNQSIKYPIIPPYTLSFYKFLNQVSSGQSRSFLSFFRDKNYPMKFTGLQGDYLAASRLISTWIECGLIDEDVRDSKGSWKKFSLKDLIWIRIIDKLRSFGFPRSDIEVVKQFLFNNHYFKRGEYLLEYCTLLTLNKAPLNLIVLNNGESHILNQAQLQSIQEDDGLTDFIKINLNQLIRDVLSRPELKESYQSLVELSDKEVEVLSLVRTGKYKNIEVIQNNGRIERIVASETVSPDQRIVDLFKEEAFQEINVQLENGKVVSIKRTIKKKL